LKPGNDLLEETAELSSSHPSRFLLTLGLSAFAALVAPVAGLLGFGVVTSVASRAPSFLRLSELPGIYREFGPSIVLASILFSLLVLALTIWRGHRLRRWQVAVAGLTAFAVVFATSLLILREGSPPGLHLVTDGMMFSLATVAGAVAGLAVPRRLLPTASEHDA